MLKADQQMNYTDVLWKFGYGTLFPVILQVCNSVLNATQPDGSVITEKHTGNQHSKLFYSRASIGCTQYNLMFPVRFKLRRAWMRSTLANWKWCRWRRWCLIIIIIIVISSLLHNEETITKITMLIWTIRY